MYRCLHYFTKFDANTKVKQITGFISVFECEDVPKLRTNIHQRITHVIQFILKISYLSLQIKLHNFMELSKIRQKTE